jgi:hypothetical protein
MAPANPFDKIAKPKEPASKKSTKKVASVTDAIKTQVDTIIQVKAKIAELEAVQADAEEAIRTHVRPQQDELGFKGDYSKSFSVLGNTGEVVYVTSDKYSVPQGDAEVEEMKKILGAKYDALIESRRTVTLLPEAAENADLITKLCAVIEKAGMDVGQVFKVEDKLATVKGTDEKVYTLLTPKQLEGFRTVVRQVKASIK